VSERDLLGRLEPDPEWLVRSGWAELVRVGPFDAFFGPGADCATPRLPSHEPTDGAVAAGAQDVPAALAELRRLFAARGRSLVVELNEPLFPHLPALLERAGLTLAAREPLMLCPAADFRPFAAHDVAVRFLEPGDPDEELRAFLLLFHENFGRGRELVTDEAIVRLRDEVARTGGWSAALARLDDRPAGTGFVARYEGGVCEITRVTTAPWARRRGVAASLTSFLIASAIATGSDLAWLTASGPPARALYAKLGFRLVGDRLYYEDRP
jgi:ribosomal protein S18 acetylase RimI-like enzyme